MYGAGEEGCICGTGEEGCICGTGEEGCIYGAGEEGCICGAGEEGCCNSTPKLLLSRQWSQLSLSTSPNTRQDWN